MKIWEVNAAVKHDHPNICGNSSELSKIVCHATFLSNKNSRLFITVVVVCGFWFLFWVSGLRFFSKLTIITLYYE